MPFAPVPPLQTRWSLSFPSLHGGCVSELHCTWTHTLIVNFPDLGVHCDPAPSRTHLLTVPSLPECTSTAVSQWPHPRPEGSAQRGGQRPQLHLHCSHELPAHHGVLPSTQVLLAGARLRMGSPCDRRAEGALGASRRPRQDSRYKGNMDTRVVAQ